MGRRLQQAYTHLWKLQLSEGVSKLKVGLRSGSRCMPIWHLALPPSCDSDRVITVSHEHFIMLIHALAYEKRPVKS